MKAEDQLEEMFKKTFEENKKLTNSSSGKDIIVLIGNTGAGKTALAAFLSKAKLTYDQTNKKNPISLAEKIEGVEIKGGKTSIATVPSQFILRDKTLYDFPGLCDTWGLAYEVTNAAF